MKGEKEGFTVRIVLYAHNNVSVMLTLKPTKVRKITLETKGWAF